MRFSLPRLDECFGRSKTVLSTDTSEQVLGIASDVITDTLSQWITAKDLVKLDSACCSKKSRQLLFERTVGLLLIRDVHGVLARPGLLQWLMKRQIRIEALDVTSGGHDQAQMLEYLARYGPALRFLCLGPGTRIQDICHLLPNLEELTNLPEADVTRPEDTKYIQSCCPKLHSLELVGKRLALDRRVGGDGWRNLTHIELSRIAVYGETFEAIVRDNPGLRSIAIHRSGWWTNTVEACRFLAEHCPKLERLNLGLYHSYMYDDDLIMLAKGCPQLQSLDLSGTVGAERRWHRRGLECAIQQCANLRTLDLSYVDTIVDDSILLLVSLHLTKLTKLSIAHCDRVTHAGLSALALGCSNLAYLDASYCDKVETEGICSMLEQCSLLYELHIVGMPLLTGSTIAATLASHGQRLRHIQLDKQLTDGTADLRTILQRRCFTVEACEPKWPWWS